MQMTDKKTEGARLREIREGLDMTREEMAARLSVSQSTIRNVENGHQRMGVRTFAHAEQIYADERYESPCPAPPEVRDAPHVFLSFRHEDAAELATVRTTALEYMVLYALADAQDPSVQLAADAMAKVLNQPVEVGLATIIARRAKEHCRALKPTK
jgi:transcriptional regulator with XRE-family HTH domain